MTDQKKTALVLLGVALVVGAVAQHYVNQEAAILGLSALEVAALGIGVGAFVKRVS